MDAKCQSEDEAEKNIKNLYNDVLCREPDAEGMTFWVKECHENGKSIASIQKTMEDSEEYKKLPPNGCVNGIGPAPDGPDISGTMESTTETPADDGSVLVNSVDSDQTVGPMESMEPPVEDTTTEDAPAEEGNSEKADALEALNSFVHSK